MVNSKNHAVLKVLLLLILGISTVIALMFYIHLSWQKLRLGEAVFRDGLAQFIGKNKKIGFINPQGEWVIEPIFQDAFDFMNSHTMIKTEDGWGIIDKQRNYMIPPSFEAPPGYFCEGLSAASDNTGKTGYMDKSGQWKILPQFEKAMSFSEGLAGENNRGNGDLLIQREISLFNLNIKVLSYSRMALGM